MFIRSCLLMAGFCLLFAGCGNQIESDSGSQNKNDVPESSIGLPVEVKEVAPDDPRVKEGVYTEMHSNGVMKIRGEVYGGKREGQWMSWYEDGKDWSQCIYKKGVLDGPTMTWYENGQVRYKGQYKEGKRSGVWVFYHENGQVQKEVDFDKTESK